MRQAIPCAAPAPVLVLMRRTLLLRLTPGLATLLAAGLFPAPAPAQWPEFRGPAQSGQAPATCRPPVTWSETVNIAWKTPIHGKGWSTPAVLGNQVWLTTATEDGKQQSALCLDKSTGRVLFDQILFTNAEPKPLGNDRNTYASPSPVIEPGRVYLHFGSYGTACLDTASFQILWSRRDLPCDHWRGPASSPVLCDGLLILTMDGADLQYLVALDKNNGAEVWKRNRSTQYNDLDASGKPMQEGDYRKAFNTPLLVDWQGSRQLISPGAKAAWAYDPASGAELWSIHWNEHSSASRTVFSPELGLVFLNTGYGKSQLWAARLDPAARGEIGSTHVAWKETKRMPNRCSPIAHEGLLYVLSDQGVATCLDAATGAEIWSERISEAPFSSSLLLAGGHLYYFDEHGKTIVAQPGRTFRKVAENQLEAGFFASPAVDGDTLIVRTTTHLYRIASPAGTL